MDRKRQTLSILWMAVVGVIVAASCTGCGKPMLYHFKHYQRPFAAISKSNQTYFHSSQTGKIIEKDRCARYCEPDCYGYEPTCWTRWPDGCEGNCPVQGDPVSQYGAPYEGQVIPMESNVISDGSMMMDHSSMPADLNYDDVAPVPSSEMTPSVPASPAPPTPSGETRLPAIRVPSLPADVESAVPSPSDATMLPRMAPRKVVPRSIAPNTTTARSTEPRSIVSKPIAKTVQPIVPTPVDRPAPIRVQPKSAAKPSPKQETKTLVEAKPKRIPSRDSILVEKELTPLPATKVARLPARITPIVKSANEPLSLETANLSVPVASSRKAKTLTDKLRVRAKTPAKRVVTDTTAADLPSQPKPARLQLGGDNVTIQVVEKVQPKKGLNTAQVVLPKAEDTGDSLIRFRNEDLASKLKKARPAFTDRITTPKTTKLPSAVKITPKATPTKISKETSVVKVKTPEVVTPKRKATLNVSTGDSSTIRFANGKSGVDISRLSAPQGSTVLRFANDQQ